ncbi:MAG TPA: hypothetical protein VHS59_11120 [Bacillota bacterium]|nr:hypothetical protein [Bacillota bacterium]
MKIGDVVTTKSYGKSLHFLVLGYYFDELSGKNFAVLALLDPSLIMTAEEAELIPTELSELFAEQEDSMLH